MTPPGTPSEFDGRPDDDVSAWDGDEVLVKDFAYLPHAKPLTTPEIDVTEVTRLTLQQFVASKNLEEAPVVVSVPGHAGLARFAKLPAPVPARVDWRPFVETLGAHQRFRLVGELPASPGQFDAAQMEQALINLLKNAHESGGAEEIGRAHV